VHSKLVLGPLVLLLACGASGRGDGKPEASGADAGRVGADAGSAPIGGRSFVGGGDAGLPSAGTGATPQGGRGGEASLGGAGGAMAGTAGALDGSWRLTELHGDSNYASATVYAISGDGTYVTGSLTNGSVMRGVRWQDDTPTVFETPSDWTYVYGRSITEDGSKVAGSVTVLSQLLGFVWDGTDAQVLPELEPGMQSSSNAAAAAISGDGHVVVGIAVTEAHGSSQVPVRWTGDTIDALALPADFLSASPSSVNRDGGVIVGTGQGRLNSGVRWTDEGVESYGMDSVSVHDVSADGRFIVGSESTVDVDTGARPMRAVRYGPSGAEYLPDPDGRGWNCEALAVSGDGAVIVGMCTEPVGNVIHPYPFLFNPERGSVPLESVLQAAGIHFIDYDTFRLVDISSDGTTLLASFWRDSVQAGLRIKITGAFP
jgi:uncharacterized membrane protein